MTKTKFLSTNFPSKIVAGRRFKVLDRIHSDLQRVQEKAKANNENTESLEKILDLLEDELMYLEMTSVDG